MTADVFVLDVEQYQVRFLKNFYEFTPKVSSLSEADFESKEEERKPAAKAVSICFQLEVKIIRLLKQGLACLMKKKMKKKTSYLARRKSQRLQSPQFVCLALCAM
jgi:hypothetical protein